jgi:hypothetical protein
MDPQHRKIVLSFTSVEEFARDMARIVGKGELFIVVAGRLKSVVDVDVVHDVEGVGYKGDIAAVLVVFGAGLVDCGGDAVLFGIEGQYGVGKAATDDLGPVAWLVMWG